MAVLIPSSLPEIDAVEVVSLRGLQVSRVNGYMAAAKAKSARCVRLSGEDAQRIAGLWRSLPQGEQRRCHDPPFGLRFFAGAELICEASICWRCHNITGRAAAGDEIFFEFDAEHPTSRQLLKACEDALDEPAPGE